MILYNSGIENHPDGSQALNAVINGNWDVADDWFSSTKGLTAALGPGSTTVEASGAVFTADDAGATIRWANGTTRIIDTVTDADTCVVTASGTVASQSFKLYRTDQVANDALMRGLTKRVRMLSSDDGKFWYWNNTTKRLVAASAVSYDGTTNQAKFGDGSEAAPSIAHLGDLNCGMWFPAADTIAFSVGGAEMLRIANALITLDEALNIALGTVTGTKIGTAVGQRIGFWNASPIPQPASANQAVLSLDVDVTGGDTVDRAAINSNFSAIQTLVNQLRADLVSAGLIKGSA